MKKLLIIIQLVISISLGATNYYVKPDGSDAAAGTSDATAWATILRVNTEWAAGTFAPGDSILFERGGTYKGTITVTESGSSGSNIYVGAYGTGNKPIITCAEEISSWTDNGSGIYYASLTVESFPNIILIDEVNTPMGRFPDSTYLILDSSVGTTSITDSELNSAVTDWDGAELVIRKNRWITDRCRITDHTNQTLTYTTLTTYTTSAGYGYFIQDDIRTLTSLGEWYFDDATNRLYMYFGAENPATYSVKYAALNNNINAISHDYLMFENLDLYVANFASVNLNRSGSNVCNYITINDCDMSFSGNHGVYAQYPQCITVNGCDISDVNVNAIVFEPSTSSASNYYIITSNTINNVYLYPGMGTKVVEIQGHGIKMNGDNTTITGNRVSNIGYIPINTGGDNVLVQNNFIDTYAFVMDDGAGVYMFNDRNPNKRVISNIVLNGIGAGAGTPGGVTSSSAHAYYSDGGSSNIVWTGNTAGYISGHAFHANVPVNETFSDNVLFECSGFLEFWKFGDAGFFDARGIFINGLDIQNNIFISSIVDENLPEVVRYQNSSLETYNGDLNDEIAHFGTIDNNYYYTNTECHIHIVYYPADLEAAPMNISKWASLYSHDENSIAVKLNTYEINSLGSNLLSNSTFTSNITGWSANAGSVEWRNTNELGNSGSLRYNGVLDQYEWYWWNNVSFMYSSISGGVIDNTKNYILRLRGKSSIADKTWSVKFQSSSTNLVQRHFTLGTSAADKEILIPYPSSVLSGALLRLKDGDIISNTDFDNIYLYEADITFTDFDQYLHLIYNDTGNQKTYYVSAVMTDAAGNTYSDYVTIDPFESTVLMGYGTISESSVPSGTGAFSKSRLGVPLKDSTGKMLIIQ